MTRSDEHVQAVVLRTRIVGDADLIVTCLTAAQGKVTLRARNARRSVKRFPGGLFSGAIGEARITRGRGTWFCLDQFTPTFDHAWLGRDLDAFAYVAYICELTDALVLERAEDASLFLRLLYALHSLRTHKPDPVVLRRYELALLDALGSLPQLDACCVCGDPWAGGDDAVGFDSSRGGVVCARHRGEGALLDAAVIRWLQQLSPLPSEPGAAMEGDFPASAACRRAVRDLVFGLLRPHLRQRLRSLEFFAKLPKTLEPPVSEDEKPR